MSQSVKLRSVDKTVDEGELAVFADLLDRYCTKYKTPKPAIKELTIHENGNMTLVVVDTDKGNRVVGWSKFNPADTKTVKGRRKDGYPFWRTVSAYNPKTGVLKAMYRAVQQLTAQ